MTDGAPNGSEGSGVFASSLANEFEPTSFFQAIVEGKSDGLFTVDSENVIVFANPAMEDVLGYAPSELIGRDLQSIMSEPISGLRTALQSLHRERAGLELAPVEVRAVHEDGHECWLTVSLSVHQHDGRRLVTGTVRDVSKRKEHREELERYERIFETIDDGIYILDSNFTIIDVNEAVTELTGYGRKELIGSHASLLASEDFLERAAEVSAKLLENRQEAATLSGEIRTKDGDVVPIETRFSMYPFDDDSFGQVGVVRDITERKQFEETLTALHDSTRELLAVETKSAVCQSIVDTATNVLDLSAASIYLFDADRNLLCPSAASGESADGTETLQPVGPDDDAIWRAFVENERIVVRDEEGDRGDSPGNVAHVPLGDHGVFVTVTEATDGFDDDDRWTLIGLLAASAEVAFSRIGREIEIRQREEERERQNRRLRRLSRVNAIIRGIDQALVQADTTEEILSAVCDHLATADRFAFVWICDVTSATEELHVEAWAGDESGYLDEVSFAADSQEPAVQTADRWERTVVSNVASDFRSAPWRKEALSRDYRSVLSVPLMHGDLLYGVLTVYGERPEMFDETTQEVFSELGETIANAMNAVETRRMLLTGDRVELEFQLRDSDDELRRLAEAAGCRISYDEFVPNDGDSIRTFFTADSMDPARIIDAGDRRVSVESLRLIEERDDNCVFEAVIDERTVASAFADHAAAVRSITVDDDEMRIVVELPQDTDVRRFVEMVHAQYPGAELVVRRDRERSKQVSADVWDNFEDELTERQLEVLRIAYHSGFFESPREMTGQEIAESVGVSQPTVNRHLRACERKLFRMFFGER